jgi:hypothetical protein
VCVCVYCISVCDLSAAFPVHDGVNGASLSLSSFNFATECVAR